MAAKKSSKKVAKKRGRDPELDLDHDDEVDDDEEVDEDDEAPPVASKKKKGAGGPLKRFRVVAVRQGYDGVQRRREGKAFIARARSEEDLPSWVELESKYKARKRSEELEEADSDLSGSSDEDI